jgi:hypothetical protein
MVEAARHIYRTTPAASPSHGSLRRRLRGATAARRPSPSPHIRIMSNGPVVLEHSTRISLFCAVAMALDGRHAITQAECLRMLPQCC